MESILFTLLSKPKAVFLCSLTPIWAIFSNGIINSCGCLWLILCNTPNNIVPLGNYLSKLISNRLFVSRLCGVCTDMQVIALHCKVQWPLVFASCLRR